jgi:serine/threonine protein kinase
MSMIGKTLAHYEITSQLGKGGMGEVFRAKDQKLGRDVAIKIPPEEFAKDADRVARFQREAKFTCRRNQRLIGNGKLTQCIESETELHRIEKEFSKTGIYFSYRPYED